jgi:hypothetical protein
VLDTHQHLPVFVVIDESLTNDTRAGLAHLSRSCLHRHGSEATSM